MASQKAYYYKKKKGTGGRKTPSKSRRSRSTSGKKRSSSSSGKSSSRAYYRGLKDGSVNTVKSLIAEAEKKREYWNDQWFNSKTKLERDVALSGRSEYAEMSAYLRRRLRKMQRRK